MVVHEEPGRDVEGDEHVDRVVLVRGEDEEDAEHVQQPGKRVQEVNTTRCVCRGEHVQDSVKLYF